MGAINFSLQTITSGSMFRPGEYVWFGQPNQIPDPDNPATLKNPYIDAELTTTANAIQGIDSDSKCEQSTDGRLYGSGTYSIRVMSKADNTGVQRYYLPEVDLTPTESDLVRLTGNVITVNLATSIVAIPDGLAVGTIYEVRKKNATQGAVVLSMSGGETVTPAALSSISINSDGDFWRIRKTTATRWDIIDGFQTGSNAAGEWFMTPNGHVTITTTSSFSQSITVANAVFGFVSASLLWTFPVAVPVITTSNATGLKLSCEATVDIVTSSSMTYRLTSINSSAASVRDVSLCVTGRWY